MRQEGARPRTASQPETPNRQRRACEREAHGEMFEENFGLNQRERKVTIRLH